jgi:hypothetical protein
MARTMDRVKFATQVNSEILTVVRELAEKEGRLLSEPRKVRSSLQEAR